MKYYQIDSDNAHWFMTDGVRLIPRASIEISSKCPKDLILHLSTAIASGYIKPVAYMSEKEYVWATLEK